MDADRDLRESFDFSQSKIVLHYLIMSFDIVVYNPLQPTASITKLYSRQGKAIQQSALALNIYLFMVYP